MSWKIFASNFLKSIPDLQGFHITHLQSSDDSVILVSVQLKDLTRMKVELTKLRIETLLRSRENTMSYWCARSTYEKSTIGAHAGIFEFNSDWHVQNSILRPIIKYTLVSLQSTTQIRTEDRLTQFSNQRGSLLKNGATIHLVSVAQALQFFAHLDMFGLRLRTQIVNEYFHEMIKECPHPSLGFFPLEPEPICGLGGHRLALYNACNASSLVKSNALMIRAHEELAEDNIGALTPFQLRIYCGQIQKFQKYLQKNNLDGSEIRENLNQNPEVLLRNPVTKDEVMLVLKSQACSSQMIQALDFSTPAKFHTLAVYMITHICASVKFRRVESQVVAEPETEDENVIEGDIQASRMSLFTLLEKLKTIGTVHDQAVFEDVFPEAQFFDSLLQIATDITFKQACSTTRTREPLSSSPGHSRGTCR